MPRSALAELLTVALVTGLAPMLAAQSPSGNTTLDGYIAGVRVAELTINIAGARTYSIKRKDFRTNQWSAAVTAPESGVAGNPSFELWGSIRTVPAKIAALRKIDWSSLQAVGWPDAQ